MIDENEFFRQATLRICGSLNLDAAMHRFLDYIKNVIPVSGIILGQYDLDSLLGTDPQHRLLVNL